MAKYDLTFVLKPTVKDEAKDKFVEKTEKIVKALDGKVEKTLEMGRKQLAYKIGGQIEGVYLNMLVEIPVTAVVQLQKKLVIDKDVLRHLLVRV